MIVDLTELERIAKEEFADTSRMSLVSTPNCGCFWLMKVTSTSGGQKFRKVALLTTGTGRTWTAPYIDMITLLIESGATSKLSPDTTIERMKGR